MRRASVRARLTFLAAFAAGAAAALPAKAAAHAPAGRKAPAIFAPLFDPNTRFKPGKTVRLRFRARRTLGGAPLGVSDVSFWLRHGRPGAEVRLLATRVKGDVFEVPFTPLEPGQYAVLLSVHGAPRNAVPPVRLGVVGVARGLVEEPPEADAEMLQRRRSNGRTR
ncbi:MAG TPA: hypothetical protein VFL36_06115 [Myxococcales bacterium]|nr:hypothetical protein [Myxococcales bacterium]